MSTQETPDLGNRRLDRLAMHAGIVEAGPIEAMRQVAAAAEVEHRTGKAGPTRWDRSRGLRRELLGKTRLAKPPPIEVNSSPQVCSTSTN